MEKDRVGNKEKRDQTGREHNHVIRHGRKEELERCVRGSEAKEECAQEVRQAEKYDQKDGTRWDGLAIAEENDQGCQSDEDVSDARRIGKDSRDVAPRHLDKKDGSDDPEQLETDEPVL